MSEYQGYQRPEIDLSTLMRFLPAIIAAALALVVVTTSVYTVGADSKAVVLRFGKYRFTVGPGLHFKLPFGIDETYVRPVRKVESLEFGFRTEQAGRRTRYAPRTQQMKAQSLMLTGDLAGAEIQWTVQYYISDLRAYLENVEDVPDTIRDVSESVMRRLVGDRSVDEVITIGREELALEAQKETQAALDRYGCGVGIKALLLKNATPPEPVKDAFDAVDRAKQEKARLVNEAMGEQNRVIPAAEGERDRVIQEARGYAARHIKEATGDRNAFLARLAAYRRAPEATRARLYLEAMEDIIGSVGELIIVDEELQGVLPLLDLNPREARDEAH